MKSSEAIKDKVKSLWRNSLVEAEFLEKITDFEEENLDDKGIIKEKESSEFLSKIDAILPFNPPEDPEVTQKGMKLLKEKIDKVHPLYLLNKKQKDIIFSGIKFTLVKEKQIVYGKGIKGDSLAAYIILEGSLSFFENDGYFLDNLNPISLFGYDGPVFGHRLTTAIAHKNTLLAIISPKTFLEMIIPFSNFAIYLERTILLKDKVFEPLDKYKQYILSCINDKNLDIDLALKLYSETNPCLHPKLNSHEIDFMAWTYALNRLPSNIFETYSYTLQNKPPFLLRVNSENTQDFVSLITNKSRPRDVYSQGGKSNILLRDMETDVLDFVSNLCLFLVESKKIREKLLNPSIIKLILKEIKEGTNTFESTCGILEKKAKITIQNEEKEALKSYFHDNFGKKLIQNIWNHQSVSVSIKKKVAINKLSLEAWSENLLSDLKKCLGTDKPIDEIDDLIVDICQGSKTTLLGCISPHLYKNKDEILKWGNDKNIQLKTKTFLNENDKLIAYSYYYYKEFPEKKIENEKMLEENGIYIDFNTFGTGVALLIVNLNKLNPKLLDPNIKFKPASKNHIILHLGYTFGNQSKEIINPVLMMLGQKARSLNIIGKAGGLTGNRSDILVAKSIFYDKNGQMVNLNMGKFDLDDFKAKVNTGVHVGPLLCVAGTILQNYDLLKYYSRINGCVGLEMEGFYFAEEVENGVTHGMLRKDFVSRFFYYVSDLPLVSGETLSAEAGNVCWEEGVGSMNAIQRHILNCIFH